MQIDRVLFPINSLGPGKRLCIWTVGCNKRCRKCANPELRSPDSSKELSKENLECMFNSVDFDSVNGVSISGGEPFYNPEELYVLLKILSEKVDDILIFTGYSYQELLAIDDLYVNKSMSLVDVLVAGEYVDEMNDNCTPLIASTNQELIFFREDLQERYLSYLKQGRKIQNVFYENNLMSVGIHNRRGD